MQLNDHTDYGLRVLMTLAASTGRRWSTRELADLHGLSFTHAQKVVQSLEGADLVDTFRGRGGGVSLARPPAEIAIGEVVSRLETHMNLVRCFGAGESGCAFDGSCALAGVMHRARAAFQAELDSVTLEDIVRGTPILQSLPG